MNRNALKLSMTLKTVFVLVLVLGFAIETFAQPQTQQAANVINQQGSLRVSPLYQRWSSDTFTFSEISSAISFYQPVSRYASVSLYGSYGSASGDVTSLSGLTDVQLSGNYYVEPANLILSLGVGIPSGKKKLKANEFAASAIIANNLFRFQVPHFGTGVCVSPGVMLAVPVNDDFVLGLGAAFQYRGPFSPLEGFGTYDPGEEISGTLGFDVRIDETSSFSGDVVYTHYSKDKVDGVDVFASGDKLLAAVQFKKYFNLDELHFFATFRTKAKAKIPIARVEPNQVEVVATYLIHVSERFSTQLLLEGRFFQATTAPLSGFNMFGVAVIPEFALSENLRVPLRLKYMNGKATGSGTLSGIEAGLGFTVSY